MMNASTAVLEKLEEVLWNMPLGWFWTPDHGLVYGEVMGETAEFWFVLVRKGGLMEGLDMTPLPGLTAWEGLARVSKETSLRMSKESEPWDPP